MILIGGLADVGSMLGQTKTINELLHAMHSSIINDEKTFGKIPIIFQKSNTYGWPIVLHGEENEISKRIFYDFPVDLNVEGADILSMEDRIIMMIRSVGHALTMDLVYDGERIEVNYFIPKIINEEMIRALRGINSSSITENGAVGMFDLNIGDIGDIFKFISKVPNDHDATEEDIQKKVESIRASFFGGNGGKDTKELAETRRWGTIEKIMNIKENEFNGNNEKGNEQNV